MMGQITPIFIISLVIAVSALAMLIGFSAYVASALSGMAYSIAAPSSAMRNTISQGVQIPNSYNIWVEWQ
ncbi:hypothetical protein M1567_01220 [Candidatus Marsarchaeota archaeon]|jgi:hypothetical protein|nr:hypothetical protein [Candidatus Marsarchaeota archaeon]